MEQRLTSDSDKAIQEDWQTLTMSLVLVGLMTKSKDTERAKGSRKAARLGTKRP